MDSTREAAVLTRLAHALGRLLLLMSLAGLASPWLSAATANWPRLAHYIDLASHWQCLYAALLLAAVALLAVRRRRQLLWLALLLLPWFSAEPRLQHDGADSDPGLLVLSANQHWSNRDPSALHAMATLHGADVLVLVEVSPGAASELAQWRDYPHQEITAANHPFGLAVLSRFPLRDAIYARDAMDIPSLRIQVDWPAQPFRLHVLHPMPPMRPSDTAARDALFLREAGAVSECACPSLLAGDLNSTPWSAGFAAFTDAGLRRAGSLQPTWPALGRGWMGIPIDQVLANPHWRLQSSQVGGSIGSDHLPVLVRLSPAT